MDVIQALIISDSSNIMQQVLSKLQESQIFVENIFEGSRRFIGVIKLPGSNNSFRRIECIL